MTKAIRRRFRELVAAAGKLETALARAEPGALTETAQALAALQLAAMANRLLEAADQIAARGDVPDETRRILEAEIRRHSAM